MTTLTAFLVACSILIIPTGSLISTTIIRGDSRTTSYGSITHGGRGGKVSSSFVATHHHSPSPYQPLAKTTLLHMALGGNYLDNIDNEEMNDNNNNSNGNNRWGMFGPGGASGRGNNSGNNKQSPNRNNGRGGGGVGTAIRPNDTGNMNYGIGGNRRQQQQLVSNGGGGNGSGGGGVPRVFSIRQPQDLLDFVVEDERLSVVKVYASWCKTCAVFDVRYRKLASQLGDTYKGNELTSRGRVRFAEMKFDDPNNEEMCRLLNATKLPYILIYKGSKGKVTDFQCGPAKFQLLVDAVNEYADPEGSRVDTVSPAQMNNLGGEQEWRVVREQQQKRNQENRRAQQATQYGGVGITNYPPRSSDDANKLKQKEDEISRLYSELSNLRKDFDRRVVQLKEEHKKESSVLNEQISTQTKEYEYERRALSKQIQELQNEMIQREKAIQAEENEISQRLRNEMKQKEDGYKETITGLNSRISQLEQDLFTSRNELQYNTNASTKEQQQISNHITRLEQEITNLSSRNQELEKELIEEKRVVVASTEEAGRVLKQLERIKSSEDEERKALEARIVELEDEIVNREKQMMNVASNSGELAVDLQRELDALKKDREQERDLLNTRIRDLEQELEWQSKTSSLNVAATSQEMESQMKDLRQESERLSSRILELEDEIDERDKLLRTSNKATDILLDNMEAQKRDYEKELDRTASLVNELEEAISSREEQMGMLQERFDSLERMASELKRREDERDETGAGMDNMGSSSLDMEREARMTAEQEVNKLMGFLKDREEEITRMRQGTPQNPFNFGALFGGGSEGGGASGGGWEGGNNDDSVENYDMLRDVLMPDEVSPPRGMDPSGAGRYDNIREGEPGQGEDAWEGAGLSSLMSPNNSRGAGRSDNVRAGAGSASFGANTPTIRDGFGGSNTPSPAAADMGAPSELPSPAMAFERRLAENPIVPAGAFGGSKPTASFFSPKSSGNSMSAPTDTPDYYQNTISNFHDNSPAMPPAASYEQRPTAPVPRPSATTGKSENIYAGAGSASSSAPTYPSPAAVSREEPVAPVPTPAMAFERRIAENPIVPAGAFGGKRPTAQFFGPKSPPAPTSSSPEGDGYSSSQSSSFPPEDDSRSKWQKLDDFEKKRVAAEAYKAFEKSLEDSRKTKPKSAIGDIAGGGGKRTQQPISTGGGGGGSDRSNKRPTTAEAKNQSQMEMERKKHQDMVKKASASATTEKGQTTSQATPKNNTPPKPTQQQQIQKQQQSAQQIQASAAQASAKRMSLAERAARAEQDRKNREIRQKAEAREAREAEIRRAELIKQKAQAKRDAKVAEEAKQKLEIQRAEELKRKAEADKIAAVKAEEAKRNEEIQRAEAANEAERQKQIQRARELQSQAEADRRAAADAKAKADAEAAMRESSERLRVGEESLDTKEMIEAALLGADDTEKPSAKSDQTPSSKKSDAQNSQQKKRVAGGFAVSKYDVVVMNSPNELDVPQLLEGSLKDLLKDEPPPKRRTRRNPSGESQY